MKLIISLFASAIIAAGCTPITTCQNITQTGSYCLMNDITVVGNNLTCLTATNTPGITIDCQGHSITANATYGQIPVIDIAGSPSYALKNCNVNVVNGANMSTAPIQVSGSTSTGSNSWIQNNRVSGTSGGINIVDSGNSEVVGNVIGGPITVIGGNQYVIINNTLTNHPIPNSLTPAMINFIKPSNQSFIGWNSIDGGWDGNGVWATDGGIIVEGWSNGVIYQNTVRNVAGCGTEVVGSVIGSSFLNNSYVGKIGTGALCGWYWLSMIGNEFGGNIVNSLPTSLGSGVNLFNFRWTGGNYIPPPDGNTNGPWSFTSNYFHDNVNQNPVPYVYGMYIDLSAVPYGKFTAYGNTFTNNNFGHPYTGFDFAVYLPYGSAIDGGGNVCNFEWQGGMAPFVCH